VGLPSDAWLQHVAEGWLCRFAERGRVVATIAAATTELLAALPPRQQSAPTVEATRPAMPW
jgi:hypothetical protein